MRSSIRLAIAVLRAKRRSLRFILISNSLGFGPKETPPPFQRGERLEPARARPVPFCFQGLRPPPLTSARVLVEAFPWRAFVC